jgi:hypothetical protein
MRLLLLPDGVEQLPRALAALLRELEPRHSDTIAALHVEKSVLRTPPRRSLVPRAAATKGEDEMRRWLTIPALALATLLWSGLASAQDTYDDGDDEDGRSREDFALAVGVGLVDPGVDTETYLMAALRIRAGGGGGERARRRGEGIVGYIEPEVGYWETSDGLVEGSDLLVGANLVGVIPFGNVDSFFGVGAGLHFVDAQVLENDPLLDDSETKLGLNAQFGLDLRVTRSVSAFGAGRFDLVQDAAEDLQSKVYLGLRARF